jgi:hypothetical protein
MSKEKKTMNSVATSFAMQPVCNAARAAHALRSDQKNDEFSGHHVCHAACPQRRTGSACTLLRTISHNLQYAMRFRKVKLYFTLNHLISENVELLFL